MRPWTTSLTANSGLQETTKQNRRRIGQRFLSTHPMGNVHSVENGRTSYSFTLEQSCALTL